MDLTKKGKRYAGVNVHDNTGGGWNVCVGRGGQKFRYICMVPLFQLSSAVCTP